MKFRSIGSFLSPRRSIQAQIGLLFGSLTILLTSILSVAVGQQTKTRIEEDTGRSMEQMAHQLTDDLDRGMYEYYIETQEIARQPAIADPQSTLDTKRAILLNAIALNPDLVWISLISTRGRAVVATDGALEGRDVRQEGWFNSLPSTPALTDGPIETLTSAIIFASAVWVDEQQQTLGWVVMAVNNRFVEERVNEMLDTSAFYDLQAIVMQGNGGVLVSSDSIATGTSWANQASFRMTEGQSSGHQIATSADGEQYLMGFAMTDGFRDLTSLDWRVMVRKDADTAFAPANRLIRNLFWTGLLLGLAVVAVGYQLGRRITDPLVKVAAAADAIRSGQELEHLPVFKGHDEIARLSQSLRGLVDRLSHEIGERTSLEKQFRAMFELALDVILVADGRDGTILQVNPAVQRVLGYMPEALINKPFTSLFPVERASRDEILDRLKVYGAVFEEQEFVRHDGSVILMDLTATMMTYRGQDAILITLRDISERQQLMLAQLESDAMRHQIEEQEEALDIKSTIVSVASHDLRNPLATILLSSDIIRRYGDRIPEEKRIGHFLRIEMSINYMQKLLDDLNLMEKLERGLVQPQPETVDMREFCQTLMDEALATTEIVRDFQFTLDPACARVTQDPRLLRQAISNLLTNALKYSREGHPIEVAISPAPDATVRITVRDYGIGIPKQDQKDLFKTFYRAKNASAIPGTGLGLAITRRAVDSMHGTLSFVSIEDEGTTFIVEIPMIQTLPEPPSS